MKIFKAKVGAKWTTEGSGMNDEIEFEMPDDATKEQIEKEAHKLAWEWAAQYLDSWAHDIRFINDKSESDGTKHTSGNNKDQGIS